MSVETTQRLVEGYLGDWRGHWLSHDVEFRDATENAPRHGRSDAVLAMGRFFDGSVFADVEVEELQRVVADGAASIEWTFRAIHVGSLHGEAPTGRAVRLPMAATLAVDEGEIVRVHLFYDAAGLLTQLAADAEGNDTMDIEETRKVVEAYLEAHDPAYLAADAVFVDTASGERHEGREAIGAMLDFVYHVALDAHPEVRNLIVGEGQACLEAAIVGTHTGEFAGVPATGKPVEIPLAVTYQVADGMVTGATVYLQAVQFLRQVGAV